MSLIYLVVGIACLILLQSLRGGLSMEFPRVRVRQSAAPDAREVGGLDLFERAGDELAELGFDGPVWLVHEDAPHGDVLTRFTAAFVNRERKMVVWLSPPVDATQPNLLLTYVTTALDDGRYAVTQVSDPYFVAVDDERTVAQTVAPAKLAQTLRRHQDLLDGQLLTPTRDGLHAGGILHFQNEHMNAIRERLLARGRLQEHAGIARPSVPFATSILVRVQRRPRMKGDAQGTIPPVRLAFFARLFRKLQDRAPAQSMQWLLLAIGTLLFLGFGWPIFGYQFTIIVLGVIVFHELGHWVAMRAFGYRNPHITLLPLLGGVTIGHETEPDAAKRAWVGLAGPLPGIILGWAALYVIVTQTGVLAGGDFDWSGWLAMTVIVLFVVNYLNILPIPPLDGSLVLRALLPTRWIAVQALTIFIGVAIGLYVAYLIDFWALGVIALLQLLPLRQIWRDAELLRRFDHDPPPADVEDYVRTTWMLERLENVDGEPTNAGQRIGQALRVLNQLDMRPMGWAQRTLISTVFLILTIVPVAGIVVASGLLDTGTDTLLAWDAEIADLNAAYAERQAELESVAAAMSMPDLIGEIALFTEADLPDPASDSAIDAAESRLGRPLPDELVAIYGIANGLPFMEIAPIDSLEPGSIDRLPTELRGYLEEDDEMMFLTSDGGPFALPLEAIDDWLLLGASDYGMDSLYYDPDAGPGESAVYAVQPYMGMAHDDLTGLLRSTWSAQRSSQVYMEWFEEAQARRIEQLADHDIEALVHEFPAPSWWQRLIRDEQRMPGPVSASDLTELDARLPVPIPDDHRRLLEIHDGFPPATLVPAAEIAPMRVGDAEDIGYLLEELNALLGDEDSLTADQLGSCISVGGYHYEDEFGESDFYPSMIWCPDAAPARRYVATFSDQFFFATLTDVMRAKLVHLHFEY